MTEKKAEDKFEFESVKTGNGFQNDLIATTNNRLEVTVLTLRELNQVLSKELSKTQSAISKLEKTIKVANEKNDRTQSLFLVLTIVGTVLAATQLVQVWDILARGVGR